MKNLDELTQRILSTPKNLDKKDKLQSPASTVKEPFLIEFENELNQFLEKKENQLLYHQPGPSLTENFAQLEEIDSNESTQPIIDINFLSDIENKVILILQYLNPRFSKPQKIEAMIIQSMLDRLPPEQFQPEQKQKITAVIQNLVKHELKQIASKKKARRSSLIQELVSQSEPLLKKRLEEHQQSIVTNINPYQRENFKKYLLVEINQAVLLPLKKNDRINFHEYLFLKKILKKYIQKKYQSMLE